MTLITNRYAQVTPTSIYENGCSVSCPLYFRPTNDQAKELLNKFRELVRKQRLELGWDESATTTPNGLKVSTAHTPPQTPAEADLGMTEETLRYAIFQRQGIAERLFVKLCRLVDVELIPRDHIEQTTKAWLDHLYGNDEKQRTKKPSTTSKRTTKRTTSSSATAKGNKK